MSPQLEPVIWLRDTGHIGIHGGADVRTHATSFPGSLILTSGASEERPW